MYEHSDNAKKQGLEITNMWKHFGEIQSQYAEGEFLSLRDLAPADSEAIDAPLYPYLLVLCGSTARYLKVSTYSVVLFRKSAYIS